MPSSGLTANTVIRLLASLDSRLEWACPELGCDKASGSEKVVEDDARQCGRKCTRQTGLQLLWWNKRESGGRVWRSLGRYIYLYWWCSFRALGSLSDERPTQ